MPSKKYRKLPENFSDVERTFGWNAKFALTLAGKPPGIGQSGFDKNANRWLFEQSLKPHEVEQWLENSAKDYAGLFSRHPNVAHVFPMTGTVFQHFFAQGVADA